MTMNLFGLAAALVAVLGTVAAAATRVAGTGCYSDAGDGEPTQDLLECILAGRAEQRVNVATAARTYSPRIPVRHRFRTTQRRAS